MPDLGASRRDAFLDDAQVIALEQVPAVTVAAPGVMLGVRNGDGIHFRRGLSQRPPARRESRIRTALAQL